MSLVDSTLIYVFTQLIGNQHDMQNQNIQIKEMFFKKLKQSCFYHCLRT